MVQVLGECASGRLGELAGGQGQQPSGAPTMHSSGSGLLQLGKTAAGALEPASATAALAFLLDWSGLPASASALARGRFGAILGRCGHRAPV